MLVLPCLLFSTSGAEDISPKKEKNTLKAFKRQGRADLLKAERNGEDGAFKLSFTGNMTGPTTGEHLFLIEADNHFQQEASQRLYRCMERFCHERIDISFSESSFRGRGGSSPSNKGTISDCKDEKDPGLSGEDRY